MKLRFATLLRRIAMRLDPLDRVVARVITAMREDRRVA